MCIYSPYRYTNCVCPNDSGGSLTRCFRAIRTEQVCPVPLMGYEQKRVGTCRVCEGVGQAVAGAEKEREKKSDKKR